jgi:hypothetical protein
LRDSNSARCLHYRGSMTKAHFKALADILRVEVAADLATGMGDDESPACRISVRVAEYLARVNPRFDRNRFLAACGMRTVADAVHSSKRAKEVG